MTALSPLPTPSSSRRTSLSTSPSRTTSPARPAQRRNRAALRDYYGLKTPKPDESDANVKEDGDVKESELDRAGFDAEGYVREVLGREGLEGLLRVEGELVSEIKSLDGERKALVYDNYSKLITATDTIRKMRTNMDPLAPTTSTLSPAIAHIAETAASLATSVQERKTVPTIQKDGGDGGDGVEQKRRQRQTVRWVLDAPRRLAERVGRGEREVAERDWEEVRGLLDRWGAVDGVEEVRRACGKAIGGV